jgi:hypothetical protein
MLLEGHWKRKWLLKLSEERVISVGVGRAMEPNQPQAPEYTPSAPVQPQPGSNLSAAPTAWNHSSFSVTAASYGPEVPGSANDSVVPAACAQAAYG